MNRKKTLPLVLVSLMLIGLLSVTLPASAVLDSLTFFGGQQFTQTGSFSDPMSYGFSVNLYSTLEIPSSWYLQYQMGFYLMNATNCGYYIAFYQYHGAPEIILSPVVGGVYYGLDGIAYHTGWQIPIADLFGEMVTVDYNSTTSLFQIRQNGALIVSNTFSGLTLTNWKVENPLGRDGISGNVHMLAFGADNSDGSYNDPQFNGIDFKIMTDNLESETGGSVNWTRLTDLGIGGGETGSSGFTQVFHTLDTAVITATPASGYVFESWFISDNFYGGEFLPTGYYDPAGRLIASLDLLHLYPTEPGEFLSSGDIGEQLSNPLTFPIVSSQFISSLENVNLVSDIVQVSNLFWHNSTGYYRTFILNAPIYDTVNNWEAFIGQTAHYVPQTVGIVTVNPASFKYYGENYTIYANFVSINYNPNNMSPIPTATPTGNTPFDWGLGGGLTFGSLSFNLVIMMLGGAGVTFASILVFMKVTQAWAIGLALLIVGLAFNLLAMYNVLGLAIFFLEIIVFSVFLYSGSKNTVVARSK